MILKINGTTYEISKKEKVIEVLKQLKIEIPNFCYDSRIAIKEENCGICVVEINGQLQKACEISVEENMEIKTHSDRVIEARKVVLEGIIKNHALDCLGCEKSGECKLQDYCYEYEVHQYKNDCKETLPLDTSNPFYTINPNKCIACGKCVAICKELQCSEILEIKSTAGKRHVGTKADIEINNTKCLSCGNCVSVCPVGALLPKNKTKSRKWETKVVRTTCSYCGVGCQIDFSVKNNIIVDAEPVNIAPNDGLLCVKGKFGYKFVNHPDRLKTPLIRKNGELVPCSWEEAYETIKEKMTEIKNNYGGDAFGGLTSARCTNEDNFIFQKLFRAVLKTNNVDHCARL